MPLRRWMSFLAAVAACAQAPEPARDVNLYTGQKEAALGAQLAQEVRRHSTALELPAAQEYVERIGRELATKLPNEPKHTFEVTGAPGSHMREPFVLPGGYIFIPATLFLTAQTEAEFAGMLAHSMAHAALRHGTRQATRGVAVNYTSIPLIFVGGWSGIHGSDDALAVPLGFLKFMREYELEADRVGAQATARAGYDPAALVRYVDRMQVDKQPAERSALPAREERLGHLERTIRELPQRQYTAESADFEQVREAVRAAAADSPRKPPTLRRQP